MYVIVTVIILQVMPGATIVVGTNQGLYANVRHHQDSLVIRSRTEDGTIYGPITIPMQKKVTYGCVHVFVYGCFFLLKLF